MLVDSHAHLNFADYADKIDEIISDAKAAGVEKIINIGTSLSDSQDAIKLATKHEGLFATVGIHPNDNLNATVDNIDWEIFENLAKSSKVVAIGETGLDFSKSTDRDRQIKLFQKQISIAEKHNLPLSIHIREAQDDLIKIPLSGRGVFHCFSGNEQYLEFILTKLPKFYISFAGNVTFRNAKPLQELAKLVPPERLLVETDCPFLSPEPLRGSQNVPANVKITAQRLAELKGVDFQKLAEITTQNAEKLFNI